MPCSHLSTTSQCVKRVINIGGPMARIRLSDPGVEERLQDLLAAKGPEGSDRRAEGYQLPDALCLPGRDGRAQGHWGHDYIAATARAVDLTNASPRATPSARTSG